MKILLIHNAYCEPGGEDVAFEAERRLLEDGGHQVVLYRRTNWEVENYSGLKRLALVRQVVWATDAQKDIAALLRQEKPDLAHIHNTCLLYTSITGLLFGAVLVLLFSKRAAVATLTVATTLLLWLLGGTDLFSTYFRRGQDTETFNSLSGRVEYWQFSMHELMKRPWTGYGAYTDRFVILAKLGAVSYTHLS